MRLEALQTLAIEKTKYFLNLAESMYNVSIPHCNILFNLKGQAAGMAHFFYGDETHKIRYNRALLEQEGEDFIENVIPHEVAHIVAQHVFGMRGKNIAHGPDWKRVMRDFKVDPERCHDYDTSACKIQRKTYAFKCECQTHAVSSVVAKNIANGRNYTCNSCKTRLVKFLG